MNWNNIFPKKNYLRDFSDECKSQESLQKMSYCWNFNFPSVEGILEEKIPSVFNFIDLSFPHDGF